MAFDAKVPGVDAPKILDAIQKEVYAAVKPYGFRKHGRTLHRFVDTDISQVINFQLGQAYSGNTHILAVNIGIRVPECDLRSFDAEEKPKKYYLEYECNIRSRLGTVENQKEVWYDLRNSTDKITADILRQLRDIVLPVFDVLSSRTAILEKRRAYPQFDTISNHLILLEEAMIHGRRGDFVRATELFNQHYQQALANPRTKRPQLEYLRDLAKRLGITLYEL